MKKRSVLIGMLLVMCVALVGGCRKGDAKVEVTEKSEMATEKIEEETEKVEEVETETTIKETEVVELEKVLYRVVTSNTNGNEVNLYDRSSYLEEPPIEVVPNGTEFNICREVFNEYENVTFYVAQLEDGTYRYILESDCQKIVD
ncbi:hypothetical protein ACTQ1U_04945 [Thermoguttaceae bacterium LCP21S3_D4]